MKETMAGSVSSVLKRYVVGLTVGWSLVNATLCAVSLQQQRGQILEVARTQARSNFERDETYRQWNAANGSVYVQASNITPPNPYLPKTPERDLITTTGKRLTQVNPAYMTRLVFDLAAQNHEARGHMSSLRPVRPENRPDRWERGALLAFERGEKEVSSVERMGSRSYLRLMSPLVTSHECLKCHGKDGYRVGDIRGGISVAVPMEPLWEIFKQNALMSAVSFTLLWLTGLGVIFLGAWQLRSTMRQRDAAQRGVTELNRNLLSLTDELREANGELEGFCAAVSHDLRSPLSVIGGYSQLIQQTIAEGDAESSIRFAGIVHQESRRMDRLIDTLLNFSRLTRTEMKRERVDLSGIARSVGCELSMAAPQRRVVLRVAENLSAQGDPELLRVVLQNLLGNAWKYTAKREEAVIEFASVPQGEEEIYFVRDNGIGFDPAGSEEIFSPFHRLGNATDFEGSGVGLATVKRIIGRHGGRIWCDGAVGCGATFHFTLG